MDFRLYFRTVADNPLFLRPLQILQGCIVPVFSYRFKDEIDLEVILELVWVELGEMEKRYQGNYDRDYP